MNKYTKVLKDEELKWFSCDLDGTLAKKIWPEEGIGEPIDGAVEAMIELKRRGFKIMVYTSRHWSDYTNIESWLNDYNIPSKGIICGKPLVVAHVDDRNVEFRGSWKEVLDAPLLKSRG